MTGASPAMCIAERKADGRGENMKMIRSLQYMALCLLMFWMAGMAVQAEEEKDAVLGILQTLSADVEVKQTAEEGAATVGSLPAGTPVIVTAEEGTWSKIICQGMEGYIPSDALGAYIEAAGQLDAEIRDAAEANLKTAEESERYQRKKRASLIWGIVGAVFVLTVFAAGIISTFRNTQMENEPMRRTRKKLKNMKTKGESSWKN